MSSKYGINQRTLAQLCSKQLSRIRYKNIREFLRQRDCGVGVFYIGSACIQSSLYNEVQLVCYDRRRGLAMSYGVEPTRQSVISGAWWVGRSTQVCMAAVATQRSNVRCSAPAINCHCVKCYTWSAARWCLYSVRARSSTSLDHGDDDLMTDAVTRLKLHLLRSVVDFKHSN